MSRCRPWDPGSVLLAVSVGTLGYFSNASTSSRSVPGTNRCGTSCRLAADCCEQSLVLLGGSARSNRISAAFAVRAGLRTGVHSATSHLVQQVRLKSRFICLDFPGVRELG